MLFELNDTACEFFVTIERVIVGFLLSFFDAMSAEILLITVSIVFTVTVTVTNRRMRQFDWTAA